MRVVVAFATSAVFGWSFVSLVLASPETIPYLAALLFPVLSLELLLAARAATRRAAEGPGQEAAAAAPPDWGRR